MSYKLIFYSSKQVNVDEPGKLRTKIELVL